MKRKNIKKINEFIDDFDFEIDNTELTLEECEIRKEEHDRVVEENLKDHPKGKIKLTIDDFRNHIQMFKDNGHEVDPDEELNDFCLKTFGEPFKKNID